MPAIKFTAFTGEQPRIIPRLLPDTGAKAAVNVRLDDGGLTPTRVPVQTALAQGAKHKTIYRHKDQWLSWPDIVHAAQGPVADDRLYFTGDGVPKLLIEEAIYPLAVPRPDPALTVTVDGEGEGDVVTRTYVYTWVTEFGEESEPSPAADPIDWRPGQDITLSGFAEPPSGRAIARQRIYRSQTGQYGTYLYFVAERDASDADFVDTIAVDAFQEPLPSANWTAPPDSLQGLVAMPNGMMAAFAGRDLYFCEPYRPHAWPEKYVLTTDSDIVGLGSIGTSLIVMTRTNPYLAQGTTPETMQMVKLEQNFPCINPHGIVDMGFAICYPSQEGLVAARADGSIGLVTANVLSTDQWLAHSPQTMVAGQHRGRYVGFYDTTRQNGDRFAGALILEIGEAPFLARCSEIATAAFFDVETRALCYLPPDSVDIFWFDAPGGRRDRLYWRSKEYWLPVPLNFGAILIDADVHQSGDEQAALEAAIAETIAKNADLIVEGSIRGDVNATQLNAVPFGGDALNAIPSTSGRLQVGVYADGRRVAQLDRTNLAVRLPSGFTARRWEIDVSSDIRISQIAMATTIEELKQTV